MSWLCLSWTVERQGEGLPRKRKVRPCFVCGLNGFYHAGFGRVDFRRTRDDALVVEVEVVKNRRRSDYVPTVCDSYSAGVLDSRSAGFEEHHTRIQPVWSGGVDQPVYSRNGWQNSVRFWAWERWTELSIRERRRFPALRQGSSFDGSPWLLFALFHRSCHSSNEGGSVRSGEPIAKFLCRFRWPGLSRDGTIAWSDCRQHGERPAASFAGCPLAVRREKHPRASA